MWRPSGLHLTAVSPANPSSILHVQSGFSKDQTYSKYNVTGQNQIIQETKDLTNTEST